MKHDLTLAEPIKVEPAKRATAKTKKANGFGFDPGVSQHHFVVHIPRSEKAEVEISEHFSFDTATGSSEVSLGERLDGQLRVRLSHAKWNAIAEETRAHLNQRLKVEGIGSASWKPGVNLLRRDFGKELVLLCWALEDADPALCNIAVGNWVGLLPEERWWLYTQTAAATGTVLDRNKGWRKAVRFALTENPTPTRQLERSVPEFFTAAKSQAVLFDTN